MIEGFFLVWNFLFSDFLDRKIWQVFLWVAWFSRDFLAIKNNLNIHGNSCISCISQLCSSVSPVRINRVVKSFCSKHFFPNYHIVCQYVHLLHRLRSGIQTSLEWGNEINECEKLITSAGRREFSTSDTYASISALSFISKSLLAEKPCKIKHSWV